jgi:hypothetical protein
MNRLYKNDFWKLDLGEGQEIIKSIINKWGIMLYNSEDGVNDIREINEWIKRKVKVGYCAEDLKELNVDNYVVQKDWLILRGVIINVYQKKQLLENELLITNQDIQA